LQYRLRDKRKSIKIFAEASSKGVSRKFVLDGFLHIHTLLLTTFLKIKNVEKYKKR